MNTEINTSPGAIAWNRLKKNKPAMFGLSVIFISVILSASCYLFLPDNSPNSNRMNLPVSLQHPGFSADFIKIPVDPEPVSLLHRIFFGNPPRYKLIAVSGYRFSVDYLLYTEYNGDAATKTKEDTLKLPALATGAGNSDSNYSALKKRFIEHRTFLLGTDRFGRDLFSRLIIGTRVSLSVGLIAVIISLITGITLGALAGFFRGWTDRIILWIINVIWSVPTLLLVVAITMALGKGFAQVFIAVGLTMWVEVARLVRGQFFSLREQQFVEAGRALGYKNARLIIRHILPNIAGPVIVIAASNFASAILLEAGLSFLGMGAQPPVPSWGMMIKENYNFIVMDAAYLAIWPGIAIAVMVLAFTMLGNGLRDAFDTRT